MGAHPSFDLIFGLLLTLPCMVFGYEAHFQITEETPPSRFGNIVTEASTSLSTEFTDAQISQFRYQLLGTVDIPIRIDAVTGDMSTTASINRDILCPYEPDCVYTILVTASLQDISRARIRAHITVLDVNDLTPQFPQPTYTLTIPETVVLQQTWVLPAATDSDSPTFGINDYRLETNSNVFALDVTDVSGHFEISLRLTSPLDRERQSTYNLVVLALDAQNTGRMDVTIIVRDSNDNPPIFRQDNYTVSILENYSSSAIIITVNAADADSGENGQIRYSFDTTTQNAFGSLFSINPTTGAIRATGVIDYEVTNIYRLTVIARDMGAEPLQATTRVVINVRDDNDCAPEITVNSLSGEAGSAYIIEGAPVGSFVAQIIVSDADSSANGNVTCNLNDNVFTLVRETDSEYRVQTKAELDREGIAVYNLAIMCEDHGQTPQRTMQQLTVNIEDANDLSPVFSQRVYTASIRENSGGGTLISTIFTATDADIGINAQITYSLSENVTRLLYLTPLANGANGAEVRTIASFDRERTPQLWFSVIATDGGSSPRNGSAAGLLNIEDINDERPQFTAQSYVFEQEEEQLPYLPLGAVSASDPDSFPSNVITYSLSPQYTALFDINKQTGELKSRNRLNREAQPSFTIVVIATDSGIPPLSSSVTVTLNLIDLNDNNPEFQFPMAFNDTVYISNTHTVGSAVTQVQATDQDIGPFGTVSYCLEQNQPEFMINLDSGLVTLAVDLSDIDFRLFYLNVCAKDQGIPYRKVNQTLVIHVNRTIDESNQKATGNKPNETAAIAVACVAGILIVVLGLSIAFIVCKRRQASQKKLNDVHRNFVTIQPQSQGYAHKQECLHTHTHSPDDGSYSPQTPSPKETDGILKKEGFVLGRGGMHQDGGVVNPAMTGYAAGHGAHFRDDPLEHERDTSSAEGSNADSGRGASEEGDSHLQASLSNSNTAPAQKINKHGGSSGGAGGVVTMGGPQFTDTHLGFESPGRRVLYNKAGEGSTGNGGNNSNYRPQISPQAPPIPPHQPYNANRSQSYGHGDVKAKPVIPVINIQHTESFNAKAPVQYFDGTCTEDVYV